MFLVHELWATPIEYTIYQGHISSHGRNCAQIFETAYLEHVFKQPFSKLSTEWAWMVYKVNIDSAYIKPHPVQTLGARDAV